MHGIVVHDFSTLDDILADIQPDVAVLCVPKAMANDVANEICSVGVKAIWNFTNTELQVKDAEPIIENIHFSDSLLALGYYIAESQDEAEARAAKTKKPDTTAKGGLPFENQATDLVAADSGAARQLHARAGSQRRQPAGSAAVAQLCVQTWVVRLARPRRGNRTHRKPCRQRAFWTRRCRRRCLP